MNENYQVGRSRQESDVFIKKFDLPYVLSRHNDGVRENNEKILILLKPDK